MTSGYSVRPVTLDDAEAYVRCHVESLAETYASIMPPEFAIQQRAAIPERLANTQLAWSESPTGPGPPTRSWIAFGPDDAVVGVARSGPGPQPWEAQMGAPPPSIGFQLHHVYTRRPTYGTGLGRTLLDLALEGQDAYLWILRDNPRAERFYARHGFVADGTEIDCGPTWFHRPMFRMLRIADVSDAGIADVSDAGIADVSDAGIADVSDRARRGAVGRRLGPAVATVDPGTTGEGG